MKRRKFVATAGLGAAAGTYVSAKSIINQSGQGTKRAFYEWRSYKMKWGANSSLFMAYIKEILSPALLNAGASEIIVYKEIEGTTPTSIHVQITFPDLVSYHSGLSVYDSAEFIDATKEYDAQESSAYHRLSSSLLHAFEGLPQGKSPIEGANLYELRIYEGYNEDAVRRKIKMFNSEEIELFLDLQLQPTFFGKMIVGPYMPCLVYMLNFRDMDHRGEAWKEFLADPRWIAMRNDPAYANTVSNIRNIYLEII